MQIAGKGILAEWRVDKVEFIGCWNNVIFATFEMDQSDKAAVEGVGPAVQMRDCPYLHLSNLLRYNRSHGWSRETTLNDAVSWHRNPGKNCPLTSSERVSA